jgi:uncharacterized protein
MTTDLLPITERTRVHRLRERQVRDRATLHEILDAGLVAHLAACLDDGPALLPVAYARDGERLLLHGSTGAGLLRAAADGAPIAVAVTHVDGLVFAGSVFDSSMNYRSAVIFGTARVLRGEERVAALRTLSEHLMPGRWDEVRPPTAREVAATLVLALPLEEASVKVRAGGPTPDPAGDRTTWAGVLPLAPCAGDPVSAVDLPPETPLPPSIHATRHRHGHGQRPTHQPLPTGTSASNETEGADMRAADAQTCLSDLGAHIAADGIAAHSDAVLALAHAARAIAPVLAAVLADPTQPEVARTRAFSVASRAVLQSPAAANSLHTALTQPRTAPQARSAPAVAA